MVLFLPALSLNVPPVVVFCLGGFVTCHTICCHLSNWHSLIEAIITPVTDYSIQSQSMTVICLQTSISNRKSPLNVETEQSGIRNRKRKDCGCNTYQGIEEERRCVVFSIAVNEVCLSLNTCVKQNNSLKGENELGC